MRNFCSIVKLDMKGVEKDIYHEYQIAYYQTTISVSDVLTTSV